MRKQEVNTVITETAKKYGFETTVDMFGIAKPECGRDSHIGFKFLPCLSVEDSNFETGDAVTHIEISASICSMGGSPSPAELLKAADEIERGARLVAELQSMNLRYTEHYGK